MDFIQQAATRENRFRKRVQASESDGSDKGMHNSLWAVWVVLELYVHITLLVVEFHQMRLFLQCEQGPQ